MKNKIPLRRAGDTVGVTMVSELSNKTKISGCAGNVSLICPICGIGFERKYSEAKRHDVSYCGRACAGIGCRVQVERECKVCYAKYSVKKSIVDAITCCSKKCKSIAQSEMTSVMDVKLWKTGVFMPGEKVNCSKLTEKQAKEIYNDSRNNAEIGRQYGITRAAVRAIKIKKTWVHIHSDSIIKPTPNPININD